VFSAVLLEQANLSAPAEECGILGSVRRSRSFSLKKRRREKKEKKEGREVEANAE
jgi:hypothetical protein